MRGLFRGNARMPIPSNLDSQLYVPEGKAGIAMANLAARMGLETTGITMPLATPASTCNRARCSHEIGGCRIVSAGQRSCAETARRRSLGIDAAVPANGELRVVDKAFGRQPAVLVRGDEAAALGLLGGSFSESVGSGQAVFIGGRDSL